jgi:hypothetical protein
MAAAADGWADEVPDEAPEDGAPDEVPNAAPDIAVPAGTAVPAGAERVAGRFVVERAAGWSLVGTSV